MERKEAIEILRKLYNESLFLKKDKEAMVTLIPELAKSEDEIIREEIINFLSLPHPQFVGKRDHEQWIAWLEKQGEPTDIPADAILDSNKDGLIADTIRHKKELVTCPTCGTKIEKQSEKSAFWSEEDEERYLSCLKRLGTGNIEQPETVNTVWLKSLKDRIQPQQEWSEEDKMQLDAAIHLVGSTGHNATVNWLRALKNRVPPQSTWKPSDEQFKLLKHIMENVPLSYRDKSEVGELYLDLKRLGGE